MSSLLKTSGQKDRRSNNSSLARDIKTPDKFIPIHQKNSSSNKKSTIKNFRPQNIAVRGAQQYGMSDSSQKKRLKVNCKNIEGQYKMPLKLDFNNRSMSNVTILTTKPSKKKITVQSNIPRAPQTKRNSQLGGTFCQGNYEERPKLSSRNNVITYSGIYNTMDNTKHNLSHHENSTDKENMAKPNKFSYNWVAKNLAAGAGVVPKQNKNFRSMTSLMNKPSGPRKFSLTKQNRYAFGEGDSASFMSKQDSQEPTARSNIFQQIHNLSRGREVSTRFKNPSITRRYAGEKH